MTKRQARKSVHFIGIGGIGVSSLARWFLAQKWAVSGSDATRSELTDSLVKEGVKLKIGHSGGVPPAARLVIYSNAIKPENKELFEARKRKIEVLSYPEMVGRITREYKTITVSGAHGKSTTTALAALLLTSVGLDPTVIVGTKLKEFRNSNFRNGHGDYLVLEADEFKKAFLNYAPYCAIVTNIDREHLDCYRDLADIKKTFLRFLAQTQVGGSLILNRDNEYLFSLKGKIETLVRKNKLQLVWYSMDDSIAPAIRRTLQIPGIHNASNALAVYRLGALLEIPKRDILASLGRYRGAWRRYERRGSFHSGGMAFTVFDDYAHHPTEIRATIGAFREKFRGHLILPVFQPHHAERLKKLFKEFVGAFDEADGLILLPTYRVKGRDEERGVMTANDLARAIGKKNRHLPLLYLEDPHSLSRKTLLKFTDSILGKKHRIMVIMMGAGDIVSYTERLLK
ncbi:MAG: UDP-N-acetylmuramate--L-alanine ligase [Patescibacteria group bacterium]